MSDQMKAILAGIVRHLVGAGGAYLAEHGLTVSGSDLDIISGAIMVVVAIGWSAWHKTRVQPK